MLEKRVLPVLFVTLLLDMVGIGMVLPLVPILFTDPSSPSFLLHAYPETSWYFIAGLITALFGIMQFFAAPILGELSDIYGRKKLLTLGVGVLAVSQIFFGFGIEIGSLALILVSRVVAGLAGANFSIVQATIADVSPPEHRARNFGLIGAAFGLGFIIGPLLGGWIAHATDNPAAPFWFAGVLGVLNMLSISFFLHETRTETKAAKSFTWFKGIHNIQTALSDATLRPYYLSLFLYMSGFVFFTSFSGVFVVKHFNFTPAEVGTYFGIFGFWMVVTQGLVLRFVTKLYSPRQIVMVTMPTIAAVLVLFPFVPSVTVLYTLLPFIAMPQGLTMANLSALISTNASGEKQGATLGISGSLTALSQGVMPIIAGALSGVFGIGIPFVVGACAMLCGWSVLRKS